MPFRLRSFCRLALRRPRVQSSVISPHARRASQQGSRRANASRRALSHPDPARPTGYALSLPIVSCLPVPPLATAPSSHAHTTHTPFAGRCPPSLIVVGISHPCSPLLIISPPADYISSSLALSLLPSRSRSLSLCRRPAHTSQLFRWSAQSIVPWCTPVGSHPAASPLPPFPRRAVTCVGSLTPSSATRASAHQHQWPAVPAA